MLAKMRRKALISDCPKDRVNHDGDDGEEVNNDAWRMNKMKDLSHLIP